MNANFNQKIEHTLLVHKQRGVTLVELMIAMIIGLLVIGGVVQIFISSQQAYRTQESMSRVQESGRIALEILSQDIRQAGFRGGCGLGVEVNNLLDSSDANYDSQLHSVGAGIEGWNNIAGDFAAQMQNYVAGTDVFLIRHGATLSGVTASGNTPAHASNINLTTDSTVPQGQIVIVADPEACDIFQNTSNLNANNLNKSGGNVAPGNTNDNFSKSYGDDMRIMLFSSDIYYIATSNANPQVNSLWRIDNSRPNIPLNDRRQELVDGIHDMQIEYGITTNGNRNVDQYVTADNVADWDDVLAVRVHLLVRGEHPNVVTNPMQLPFGVLANGAINLFVAQDNNLYQTFTTTVSLRNKTL